MEARARSLSFTLTCSNYESISSLHDIASMLRRASFDTNFPNFLHCSEPAIAQLILTFDFYFDSFRYFSPPLSTFVGRLLYDRHSAALNLNNFHLRSFTACRAFFSRCCYSRHTRDAKTFLLNVKSVFLCFRLVKLCRHFQVTVKLARATVWSVRNMRVVRLVIVWSVYNCRRRSNNDWSASHALHRSAELMQQQIVSSSRTVSVCWVEERERESGKGGKTENFYF